MKLFLKILSIAVVCGGIWYFSGVAAENRTNDETVVSEFRVFHKCGHSRENEYPIPEKAVGLSGEEATKVLGCGYGGFEGNRLSVSREIDGYCPDHYRVFLEDNVIKAEALYNGSIVSQYPTAPAQFSEYDTELLESGIIVNSREELSSVLEDFTS